MTEVFSMDEYFRVNVEKKLFIKVPEQEDHDLTPATRLLEKRREMLEVENGLIMQKEEFSMKMESLSQRREELARKEVQLKESLMKFDKFLKENDAKRTRALKKSMEERKMKEQKEVEIHKLKETQSTLTEVRDRQAEIVDKNLIYQRFLESVLESTDEFGETKDILSRYDTLAATNIELIERARDAQERTERDRIAFTQSTEEKNNRILNYNNEIAKLQTKLEECQSRSAKWQAEWDQTLKTATQKSLLLGQVKISNIVPNSAVLKDLRSSDSLGGVIFTGFQVGTLLHTASLTFTSEKVSTLLSSISTAYADNKPNSLPLLFGVDITAWDPLMMYNLGTVATSRIGIGSPLSMATTFNKELGASIAQTVASVVKATGFSMMLSPNIDLASEKSSPSLIYTFGEDPYVIAELSSQFAKTARQIPVAAGMRYIVSQNDTNLNESATKLSTLRREVVERVINDGLAISLENGLQINGFSGPTFSSNPEENSDIIIHSSLDRIRTVSAPSTESLTKILSLKSQLKLLNAADTFTVNSQALTLLPPIQAQSPSSPPVTDTLSRLALQTARESVILLKNNQLILPGPANSTIGVFGAAANDPTIFYNSNQLVQMQNQSVWWNGKTLAQALTEISRATGGRVYTEQQLGTNGGVQIQAAIVALSSSIYERGGSVEKEWVQNAAAQINGIKQTYGNTTVIVAVVVLDEPEILGQIWNLADAVLITFRPGMYGAQAISETIFGSNNPSGRLPISYPSTEPGRSVSYWDVLTPSPMSQLIAPTLPNLAVNTSSDLIRRQPPAIAPLQTDLQFPFGLGMTYSWFWYTNMTATPSSIVATSQTGPNTVVQIKFSVKNKSELTGKNVATLFASTPSDRGFRLIYFDKRELKYGESWDVVVDVDLKGLMRGKDSMDVGEYIFRASDMEQSVFVT
ncbi:Cilia- and flagella-associated protein 73 [Nowakowskiella sp. JEL0407]|nr:Cilia- and flagella-associated protein 73 [Nowakowskiella sp. JEL0407]